MLENFVVEERFFSKIQTLGMDIGQNRNFEHPLFPLSVICILQRSVGNLQLSVPTFQTLTATGRKTVRHVVLTYTPFTRSSKHRANVEQMYSEYTC